jgi:Raf kinase inhibitor-like YbhB/YbcL family protein
VKQELNVGTLYALPGKVTPLKMISLYPEKHMGFVSVIGQLTRHFRAGEDKLILNQPEFVSLPRTIRLTSSAFPDGEPMPEPHTVSGEDISPPLQWSNLPPGTRELVLFIEDFDIPLPPPMVHLIVYGLPPTSTGLEKASLPNRDRKGPHPLPKLGRNGMGFERYDGPAPIPGHGPHHYVFELFAVNKPLSFDRPPGKDEVLEAIKDHVLATGRLTGTFERN